MDRRERTFRSFAHKGANFRISIDCDHADVVEAEIVRLREVLEDYIARHGEFGSSLEPVAARPDAPEIARRMAAAAEAVGVGPMAAVAGTVAQMAAETALAAGAQEIIVENGGDLYAVCTSPLVVGLYAGDTPLADRLAVMIDPERTPLAICSSSSRMGHSMSLGDCDLATVAAADAPLADAAATQAANLVRSADDIDAALQTIAAIQGIQGVLLVKGDRIGLTGQLGELVRNRDAQLALKVTRDPQGDGP